MSMQYFDHIWVSTMLNTSQTIPHSHNPMSTEPTLYMRISPHPIIDGLDDVCPSPVTYPYHDPFLDHDHAPCLVPDLDYRPECHDLFVEEIHSLLSRTVNRKCRSNNTNFPVVWEKRIVYHIYGTYSYLKQKLCSLTIMSILESTKTLRESVDSFDYRLLVKKIS